MRLSILLFSLLASTLNLAAAQSSPITCLFPSNTSFIVSAGQQLQPNNGCRAPDGFPGEVYLVWPDLNNMVMILLGSTDDDGNWNETLYLPETLPVYGFGWMMWRPGSVQVGNGMFIFATELSPAFAILPPTFTSTSSGLKPGDIRLLEPSDVPVPFNRSVAYWPVADRVSLFVEPGVSSAGAEVTLLLYVSTDPFPFQILGEDIPLPLPGQSLDYFINLSAASEVPNFPLQVVVVPSLSDLTEVLAVSGLFMVAGTGPGNLTATATDNTLHPTITHTLVAGPSFSAGVNASDYTNTPSKSYYQTSLPATASPTQVGSTAAPSGPSGVSPTSGATMAMPIPFSLGQLALGALAVGLQSVL